MRSARLFLAVYATAGQLLFLACPRKSNQKEGHHNRRTLQESPALLTLPGGCGTRAIRCAATRSDNPRRHPPAGLCYSAAPRGPKVNTGGASTFGEFILNSEKFLRVLRGENKEMK